MSRDDTIGIFCLKHNGKSIYIVIHDQCIENYENFQYILFKHTLETFKWTYSFKKAMSIARLILKQNPYCEYGIKIFNDHRNSELISSY